MTTSAPTQKAPRRGSLKGEFYRQCRQWHGYLSAAAFTALMFFSITGLFLNHPDWFKPHPRTLPERVFTLSAADLAAIKAAKEPGPAIAKAVGKQIRLTGAFTSGETVDGEVLVRLESAKGSSDLTADLATGKVRVAVERKDLVTAIDELHRGKNASAAWKLIIDVTAIAVLALSLVGYVLFFSLRFRLRTSLVLTGVSVAILVGAFLLSP